jgi:hypothetical protein
MELGKWRTDDEFPLHNLAPSSSTQMGQIIEIDRQGGAIPQRGKTQ